MVELEENGKPKKYDIWARAKANEKVSSVSYVGKQGTSQESVLRREKAKAQTEKLKEGHREESSKMYSG